MGRGSEAQDGGVRRTPLLRGGSGGVRRHGVRRGPKGSDIGPRGSGVGPQGVRRVRRGPEGSDGGVPGGLTLKREGSGGSGGVRGGSGRVRTTDPDVPGCVPPMVICVVFRSIGIRLSVLGSTCY